MQGLTAVRFYLTKIKFFSIVDSKQFNYICRNYLQLQFQNKKDEGRIIGKVRW